MFVFLSFKKFFLMFIYLFGSAGLSCGTQDL